MTVQNRFKDYLPDQREYFDLQISEDWEDYASEEWDRVRRFEVARLFAFVRPARILDVGCGCGFHDREMGEVDFVERVDAIDYSAKSVEKAEEHYPHAKVRRWVGDLEELETDAGYDLVTSFQVVEHAPSAEVFLRRCGDLCGPGGHVAVFTVNRLRPYNRKRMRQGKAAELEDPMHRVEFVLSELEALGRGCGLEPARSFSYAADAPRIPGWARVWAGYYFPRLATRIAVVFRKPDGL